MQSLPHIIPVQAICTPFILSLSRPPPTHFLSRSTNTRSTSSLYKQLVFLKQGCSDELWPPEGTVRTGRLSVIPSLSLPPSQFRALESKALGLMNTRAEAGHTHSFLSLSLRKEERGYGNRSFIIIHRLPMPLRKTAKSSNGNVRVGNQSWLRTERLRSPGEALPPRTALQSSLKRRRFGGTV